MDPVLPCPTLYSKVPTVLSHYIVSLPPEGELGLGLYPETRLRSLTTLWRGVTTTFTGEFDASYCSDTSSSRARLRTHLALVIRNGASIPFEHPQELRRRLRSQTTHPFS